MAVAAVKFLYSGAARRHRERAIQRAAAAFERGVNWPTLTA